MHSYLIFAKTKESAQKEIEKLVNKLGATGHEFKAGRVEEVRNLNSFVRLKVDKPTAIIIKDIEDATSEALNALLKNLEEPQKNLSFILITSFLYKVLPTISSRCQIIRAAVSQPTQANEEVKRFLEMPTADKLAYADTLKGREEAAAFIEQIILYTHQLLHKQGSNYRTILPILKNAQSTLLALEANGNVLAQMTNFTVNYPL